MFDVSHPEVHSAVAYALAEDIGSGDVTSRLTVPSDLPARGTFIAKQDLVLAGIELLPLVYEMRGGAAVELLAESGTKLKPGDAAARVSGVARTLLECERVALNFLQRLSGIATLARQHVDAVSGTKVKVLDTRKTTPGMRALEKAAVVAGGGVNHRIGLYDMVLVKDNHLATFGGLSSFADRIRQLRGERPNIRIEVEADDLDQARAFVEIEGIDVILLDNMPPAQMREAIALRKDNIRFEASGGITLKNVKRVAATGVDYISIGGLTNAARAIDIAL